MTNLTAEELLEMEKQDAIEREKMFDWMKSIGWKQEEQDGKTFWRGPNLCTYGEDEAVHLSHEWWLRDTGWVETVDVMIEYPKFMHHDMFKLPTYKAPMKYWIHPISKKLYLEHDAVTISKNKNNDDDFQPEGDKVGKSLNKVFNGHLGTLENKDIVHMLYDIVDEDYILLKLVRNKWMRCVQMGPYWEKAYNEQKETNSQKLS